jgi:protein-disulfide isomerase
MQDNLRAPEGKGQPEEAGPQPETRQLQPGKRTSRPGGGWPLTIILCLNTLVVGMIVGFLGRPLIAGPERVLGVQTAIPRVGTPLAGQAAATTPVPADPSAQATSQAKLLDAATSTTRHFIGDANAPITIIEFADFQCPYCGQFQSQTWPQINEQYVKKGLVRFGYHQFAFLGPESTWAAEASECAADQNAFWQYHDKLYAGQAGENQGAFNKDKLKQLAVDLKLDAKAFDSCLDSGKYTAQVNADSQAAGSLGVTSTPSFVVNGQALSGALPFAQFQQVIEAATAKK